MFPCVWGVRGVLIIISSSTPENAVFPMCGCSSDCGRVDMVNIYIIYIIFLFRCVFYLRSAASFPEAGKAKATQTLKILHSENESGA